MTKLSKTLTSKSNWILHTQAQVIVTGTSLTHKQAEAIINFSKTISLSSWCSSDGLIGHIDSIKPNTTYEQLYADLMLLAQMFKFLELGISIMSGPPGSYTHPLVSFRIYQGKLKQSLNPHAGHPAPKRLRKES